MRCVLTKNMSEDALTTLRVMDSGSQSSIH